MTRAMKAASRRATRGNNPVTGRAGGAPDWKIRRARGIQIVESPVLARFPWLVHGFSTSPGGQSLLGGNRVLNLGFTEWDDRERVTDNRAKFAVAVAGQKMSLIALQQIHSDIAHVAAAQGNGPQGRDPIKAQPARGDALITYTAGLLLGVQTADCVPILLADKKLRVVVAIHAGWRGTLARIAVKTLGRMRMEFGSRARDVVAALGPAIGPCCYEVGPEVAQAFATQFPEAAAWFDGPFEQLSRGEEPLWLPWLTMMPPGHVPPPPRVQLDLRAANRWQLIDAGVPAAQVTVSNLCTSCSKDLLFSYRREGPGTGRMMAVIGIPRGK